MISVTDGRWSSSSRVGCWGIWSSPVAPTDEGLLSNLLKCSSHHSLKASWSLIGVVHHLIVNGWVQIMMAQRQSSELQRTVWNYLSLHMFALHLPFCPTNGLSSHAVTSRPVLWDAWICLPWIWSLGHVANLHKPGSSHVAAEWCLNHSHWTNPDVHVF